MDITNLKPLKRLLNLQNLNLSENQMRSPLSMSFPPSHNDLTVTGEEDLPEILK